MGSLAQCTEGKNHRIQVCGSKSFFLKNIIIFFGVSFDFVLNVFILEVHRLEAVKVIAKTSPLKSGWMNLINKNTISKNFLWDEVPGQQRGSGGIRGGKQNWTSWWSCREKVLSQWRYLLSTGGIYEFLVGRNSASAPSTQASPWPVIFLVFASVSLWLSRVWPEFTVADGVR